MNKLIKSDGTISIEEILNIFKDRAVFFFIIILITTIPQIYFNKTAVYLNIYYDYNKFDKTIEVKQEITDLKTKFIIPYIKKEYQIDKTKNSEVYISEDVNVGFQNPLIKRPYGLDRVKFKINITDFPKLNSNKEIKRFIEKFNEFISLSLISKKEFLNEQLDSTTRILREYNQLKLGTMNSSTDLITNLNTSLWLLNKNYNKVYFGDIATFKIL